MTTEPADTGNPLVDAMNDALNNPKHFGGQHVTSRVAARYKHPHPNVTTPAVSSSIDQVTLDDGAVVFQCRTCGKHWDTAASTIAHTAVHSPKKTGTDKETDTVQKTSTAKPSSKTAAAKTSAAADVPDSTGVRADVADITRDLEAIATQFDQLGGALFAIRNQILTLVNRPQPEPEYTPEEIAAMVADSAQLKQLRGLLSQ